MLARKTSNNIVEMTATIRTNDEGTESESESLREVSTEYEPTERKALNYCSDFQLKLKDFFRLLMSLFFE